jgi:hypothetical protein
MRLQIFDQAGPLVYDRCAVTRPELTWVLWQPNGETVKTGPPQLITSHLSLPRATTCPARRDFGLRSGFPVLSFASPVIVSAPQPWRWKESRVVRQQPP